jgi:hypothetical protein
MPIERTRYAGAEAKSILERYTRDSERYRWDTEAAAGARHGESSAASAPGVGALREFAHVG